MRSRRQRLGQHFLRDAGTARSIAAALAPEPARVLEIGPGRGALTAALLERFPRVLAVEIDAGLARSVAARLGRPDRLEVRHADALTADLDELAAGETWQVAANLPYGVASPILRRLLARGDLFPTLVVMVQAEVARRLAAPPGGAARGLLTLEVETHARAELLFEVPARRFDPPPKVTSAVVRLALRPPPEGAAEALALASASFAHRRKTLANGLASVAAPAAVAEACAAAGVSARARPQEPTLAQWLALARALPAAPPGGR